MSDKLKDILSHLNPDIDQELLLQYLQGKLPPDQHHELEKKLMQGSFEEDALEGLESFKDKEQLQYTVEMLNRDLRQRTARKKKRREKMKLAYQPWIYVSILILLLLIVLSYIMVRRMLQS